MASPAAWLQRISRMGPHEVYTRVRQAAASCTDDIRHRLGLPPAQPPLGRTAARGHFFFDPPDAPALARAWAVRNPPAAQDVVNRARSIAAHRFSLLGYRDLDFGSPIDWHLDAAHSRRTRLIAWRKVPYLDFATVGDHKVVWELNRHQHLMTLVRAWLFTGEDRWIDEAIAQWRHWQRRNPYPLGINWTSTLEVGFRVLSWIWIDHWLQAAGRTAFRQELASAIGHGARHIERYLSMYFAPNTHLLGEAVALFFVGTVYKQFRDAPRWSDEGWRIVLEQARAQVREDGFHFEQSVYYHVYALDFLLHARILAARNGRHSPELDRTIERMADALYGISQTGVPPRYGDDDGGRVFDPSRNRTAELLDPLAVAAVLYQRPEFKVAAGGAFTEEAWWLLGADAGERFETLDGVRCAPRSAGFAASGYYALAANHALLIVDAGPHGWGRGGHAHADALSVQLLAGRRALLTDPGTGAYPAALPFRDRLRGTSAHSTLEIDGRSQAVPAGSFGWSNPPRVAVERWQIGRQIDLFAASSTNDRSAAGSVLHRRWIVGCKNAGWLVRDTASGQGRHRFDLRWRLAPQATLISSAPWEFQWPDGARLAVVIAPELAWDARLEEAEFSPVYGEIRMAPLLRLSCERDLPLESAAVLVTGAAGAHLRCLLTGPAPALYEWRDDARIRYLWFGEESGDREAMGWRTDAAFFFAEFDQTGSVECICISDATRLEAHGTTVLDVGRRIDFLEWRRGDAAPVGALQWKPDALKAPLRA
jgi:hypothetical protein